MFLGRHSPSRVRKSTRGGLSDCVICLYASVIVNRFHLGTISKSGALIIFIKSNDGMAPLTAKRKKKKEKKKKKRGRHY